MTVSNGDVLKGFIEIVLADGTITNNVFWFLADFLSDQSDYDVANTVESYIEDIYSSVATYLADDFTINPSYLHQVSWDPATYKWITDRLVGTLTPSFTHTNTDDPFPNQVSPVLVANTGRPGTRGRKFLTGFVETAAEASDLVSGAVTALTTALNHYLADETISAGNELKVGVGREANGAFALFTNGVVDSAVGTQRRRKPGVGT